MTTVADSISWAANETELKTVLGIIGTAEDELLKLWLDDAIEAADQHLGRDFVPIKVRLEVQSGVAAGDQFSVTVDDRTGSHTAGTGATERTVGAGLRASLNSALASLAVSVSGFGQYIEVVSDDGEPFEHSTDYTPNGGTSGFVERVYYDDIPHRVKTGVYIYVKTLRAIKYRPEGLKAAKTGQLAETYDDAGAAAAALKAARPYWDDYVADPLLV